MLVVHKATLEWVTPCNIPSFARRLAFHFATNKTKKLVHVMSTLLRYKTVITKTSNEYFVIIVTVLSDKGYAGVFCTLLGLLSLWTVLLSLTLKSLPSKNEPNILDRDEGYRNIFFSKYNVCCIKFDDDGWWSLNEY